MLHEPSILFEFLFVAERYHSAAYQAVSSRYLGLLTHFSNPIFPIPSTRDWSPIDHMGNGHPTHYGS
jgi:hypothetical protein